MTAPAAPPNADGTAAAVVARGSLWARFIAAHLFDYNAASRRLWLLLAGGGIGCVLLALVQLTAYDWRELALVQLGIGFVALAALFPVRLPRTTYLIGVGDIFIFALLAVFGVPAAVLAAAAEGAIGAWRNSKRLTSRLGTPSAAALAMTLCGIGFGAARELFIAHGTGEVLASAHALCLVALPYFAAATLPLMAVVAVKRGERLRLSNWFGGYAWFGGVTLLSASMASLLYMNSRQFGFSVIFVAAGVAATVVLLVNVSLKRNEADRARQEERLAEAKREAELNQQRFTASFSHAAIGMAIAGRGGVVLKVNQALCALLRRGEDELLGQPFKSLLHPADVPLFERRAVACVAGLDVAAGAESQGADPAPDAADCAFSMELRCRDAAGAEIWVSLHSSRFADPGGGASLIYQLHDITTRRLAEGELHHIAYHDTLTDLANRACFNERLEVAVERSRTDASHRFAVMFLDLDRFKVVNDSLGHHAGNTLLQEVARRLVAHVRPGDLVARLGGDEFAVLLEHLHAPEAATALAQRLLDATAVPVQVNGTEVIAGVSIGVTFSDLGYRTVDEVLRDADLAMYEAKAGGRHRMALFHSGMLERITEKLQLEGDLRRAIGEGQLSVVYQPLYELEPQRLIGFEALARWTHPQRGPISPAVFITLAEESGHIEALTHWVVDVAAAQLAQWQQLGGEHTQLGVNVNISGRDLADAGLVDRVREVLQRHRIEPSTLTLEITETTLMGRLDIALQTLDALRALGIRLSIDDFGTGYSSLSYLSRLPIDSLKIDRSFVAGLDRTPQNVEIVRTVLMLGRTLNKRVVAEGIETPEQLATLRDIGVHIGQGYLLSRPLRADQVQGQVLGVGAAV